MFGTSLAPHYGKGIHSVPQSIGVDHIGLRTYRFENYCNWKCVCILSRCTNKVILVVIFGNMLNSDDEYLQMNLSIICNY